MALARNFKAQTSTPNKVDIFWDQPLGFNGSSTELIITRTTSHFPVELFNSSFPNRATDSRGVEIFRGSTIVGINTGNISVLGNVLTDTSANFPTSFPLTGRLLRDSNSKVFKIISNTSTTVTLSSSPTNGKYVILSDFPSAVRQQQNFEPDLRTVFSAGSVSNLVSILNGSLSITNFIPGELANLLFRDGSGNIFIIKDNDINSITFFESNIPTNGIGMTIYNSFNNSDITSYSDTFLNDIEATTRSGTGLLDNTFYYYTIFDNKINVNVAQAEFSIIDSGQSSQSFAISTKDSKMGDVLYNYWPTLYRELDTTEDLQDLMQVFGLQFNELHSIITTYRLQDTDKALVRAVKPLSEQFGLQEIGYSIGADTLRRIGSDLLSAWKLKGSKEGIALFIRIITTWDITDGTGDFSGAISDFLPNISALRFFDPNLGSLNTRITKTDPVIPGGRFAKTLPGIVIPGFFTFREFVVNLPNIALYLGTSQVFTTATDFTIMEDNLNNFGSINSLVGNFLIPNEEEVNDIYQITANTVNTITVKGIINNKVIGGNYVVLSPLNANRFIILNKLLPNYIPFKTQAGFKFTLS